MMVHLLLLLSALNTYIVSSEYVQCVWECCVLEARRLYQDAVFSRSFARALWERGKL